MTSLFDKQIDFCINCKQKIVTYQGIEVSRRDRYNENTTSEWAKFTKVFKTALSEDYVIDENQFDRGIPHLCKECFPAMLGVTYEEIWKLTTFVCIFCLRPETKKDNLREFWNLAIKTNKFNHFIICMDCFDADFDDCV